MLPSNRTVVFFQDTTRGSCGCGGRGHVDHNYWTLTEPRVCIHQVSLNLPLKFADLDTAEEIGSVFVLQLFWC